MFQLLSDPKWVARYPFVTTLLLEAANVQQMWQMWMVDHGAEGQSLTGWLSVQAALWLWLNYYRVMVRGNGIAFWCQALGIAINMAVCLSVVYWRYF